MTNAFRTLLFLGGGLVAGFAVATFILPSDGGERWGAPAAEPLDGRLGELERRLDAESAARIALAAEIDALRGELAALASADPSASVGAANPFTRARRALVRNDDGTTGDDDADGASDTPDFDDDRPRPRRGPPTQEELEQRRIQRFVEAGFTADRAAWIETRTAELQMAQLEAEYEAARSGDTSRVRDVPSIDEALRAELGDAEYERYLDALGRPTRIGIRTVLSSSPAEQVGLRPGDEIVSYAGQRVFAMDDLNDLTLEGRPGESVVVEVLRDGQPMQFVVPRGPIGISGGGRRWP